MKNEKTMKKDIYIKPVTENVIAATEQLLITASPGISDEPWDPDMPIDAKEGFFGSDDQVAQPHNLWDD